MKKITGLATAACAALLVLGSPSVLAMDAAAFKAAYEAADAERMKAAKVGMEWRDTKKMLKKAKKLADKGKFADAIKLTDKAKMQGMAGQQQAKVQADAWKAAVLK